MKTGNPGSRDTGRQTDLPRVSISIKIDPVILEAITETAQALVMGRALLIELAVKTFLETYELPGGQP